MQQNDPWSLDAAAQPARTEPKVEPQAPTSLEDALLALDHDAASVFAVLDGAQFDNLPQELLLGDFVSRPLYLDRGDNNPEQIITAPHMVWLDERPEKITGRAPKETIPALMALIANRPAAVFWQCPDGAEALYKHLRGINMVMYPKAALTDYAEPELAETDEEQLEQALDTHTLVLFRHADANVIAQTVPALNVDEMARFFGPASCMFFAPDLDWADGREWMQMEKTDGLPKLPLGPLVLSEPTVAAISGLADLAAVRALRAYLLSADRGMYLSHSRDEIDRIISSSIRSGQELGFKEDFSYFFWSYLMMATGGSISKDPSIIDSISRSNRTPDEQLEYYVDNFLRSQS